jgi:tol-pal system protein YbgF
MPKAMIRSVFLLALVWSLWAGAAHAQMSESDLLMRIDQLQAQVRDLTGKVEDLQHRNQQLEQQLQQAQQGQGAGPNTAQARPNPQYASPQAQYSSQPYPPAPTGSPQYAAPTASAQYSPPPYSSQPASGPQYTSGPQYSSNPQYSQPAPTYSSGAPGSIVAAEPAAQTASSGRHDAFNPALDPGAPGAPRQLGAPGVAAAEPPPVYNAPPSRQAGAPLDLSSPADSGQGGQLPPPPPINPNATGAMQASLPPSNTPKDEFDLGYGYVQHKDYASAEQTLHDFLQKYPSDRLTPEAQYWLGEALFQDKHYRDAAESFLAVSTKYENTPRAPEALMRLGQSLAALGEKEAACASLGEVLRKYPKASPALKQNVDREQKRVHC